jgi:integrase
MKQQSKKTNAINLKLVENNKDIACYKCGSKDYYKKGKTVTNKQRYLCKKCGCKFVTNPEWKPLEITEDVLTALELGLEVYDYDKRGSKLNLSKISQIWLKQEFKRFIRYKANHSSFATLRNYLYSIQCFSLFLSQYQLAINNIEEINRSIVIDYINHLNLTNKNTKIINDNLVHLQNFFETGFINHWFKLPPYLIRPEDKFKRQKNLPRYIPEEVMFQLNEHLDALPEPIMRMVLVIQECGLRIGELCLLKINCLKQDSKGDWFIQFMRYKMKNEDTIPISLELAKVIQEQQNYIQELFGHTYTYLFCGRNPGGGFNPVPRVIRPESFINFLKKLADENNICDQSGKKWNFQTHQFRHTVGTRMINNGVPQHIVQRYLGHESPEMTSVYAHIHDQTLKKEIAKYHDSRVVNVAGEVVESSAPELDNDLDLHLLKKKVLAQSLPNGSCARPIVLGECPHANACLTCGDFRTTIEFLDQHKAQLEETEKLVKNAEEKGWKRHAEMNTKVRDNLKKIITTLEFRSKDIVSGGDE